MCTEVLPKIELHENEIIMLLIQGVVMFIMMSL